jgi:hypothetical protein
MHCYGIPVMRARLADAIRLTLGASVLALGACSSDLPRPRYMPHPREALAPVPFPPPPARVEFVPAVSQDNTVWVDGQWLWVGREWAWVYGSWVSPPEGARYSPWGSIRDRQGRLYYAPGTWRTADGRPIERVPVVASGSATDEDITDEEGALVETGPNIPATKKAPD